MDKLQQQQSGLRTRVTLYYLTATAVLMITVFVAVYFLVRHAVYSHLDAELQAEAREFLETVRIDCDTLCITDQREWMEREHITIDFTPQFAQVVSLIPEPVIVKKSFNLFSDTLAYNPSLSRSGEYSYDFYGDPVRQAQLPVFHQGRVVGQVMVASPLSEAVQLFKRLGFVLLVSLPVVLLILFVVTRFVVGKSVAPIEQIIDTAENISRENFDDRVLLPENRDEIYRLAWTINNLLDRLQDAYSRERQFTADASHELKTPLASVMGTLEVLVRKPREREYYEERIRSSIVELRRMARVIDQLLLLARIDENAAHPGLREVQPSELMYAMLERFAPHIEQRALQVQLHIDNEARCLADREMLEIMFENLLSNAVKYSETFGVLRLTIESGAESVLCSVTNSGVSLSEETRKKLFDRFYRVDASRNSRVRGSGLGLSVVKKLADIQGIGVSISSPAENELAVTLSIPLVEV